jgi:hypothetical protein
VSGDYAGKRPFETGSSQTQQVYIIMLFEQIALGNLSAVKRLVDGGVPADAKDGSKTDDSTLHWACSFGHLEVAKLLLEKGCDATLKNANSESCLHVAVKNQHADIVKLLLDEGAIPGDADSAGKQAGDLLQFDKADSKIAEAIKSLLLNPPAPSFQLHNKYLRMIEAAAVAEANTAQPAEELVASDTVNAHNSEEEEKIELTVDSKKLVFWPPVQKQSACRLGAELVLRSDQNLLVCVASHEVDIFPVLTSSGFLDCLDVYGFQVQVKRTALGAKVRLCIDANLCPFRHSYQLTSNQQQLLLVASDYTGLLYGMYTLIQLIQLHSNIGLKAGVTQIAIPAVQLSDFPQTPQRAVLWSFRQKARMQSHMMRESIELLSKLRINMLLLMVDPVMVEEAPSPLEGQPQPQQQMQNESTSTKVCAMDEDCRRRCVELVPTVVIRSVHERSVCIPLPLPLPLPSVDPVLCRLPLDVLKNFSHSMITLILNYSSSSNGGSADADAGDGVGDHSHIERCRHAVKTLLKDAQLAGFSTVQVTCSAWTKRIADPSVPHCSPPAACCCT